MTKKKKKKPDRTEKRDKPAITLSKIDKTLVVTHKTKQQYQTITLTVTGYYIQQNRHFFMYKWNIFSCTNGTFTKTDHVLNDLKKKKKFKFKRTEYSLSIMEIRYLGKYQRDEK